MKRLAFYVQDTGDPSRHRRPPDGAAPGRDRRVRTPWWCREYVDYRNLGLYRMLGEATQEEPPFDELLVPDAALLGDTEDEVQKRLAELAESGVRVRVADGSPKPAT